MLCEVHFDDQVEPRTCDSARDLEALLDRLQRDCASGAPILVRIEFAGHRLDLGVGADPTFLALSAQPSDGEAWISVGNPDAPGALEFWGCGGRQDVPRRHLVPLDLAREAVREFVATSTRSGGIRWEAGAGRPTNAAE